MKLKIPRQIKSQKVKEGIFAAAQELMLQKGYEYVTVANVCLAAGVSAGSFYHHFQSKDELLAYYFIAGYEKHRDQFEAISGKDVIKNVTDTYGVFIEYCLEQNLSFMKSFYTPENKGLRVLPTSGDDPTAVNASMVARTAGFIEDAKGEGHIPETVEPRKLAMEMCTLVKGCIFEWCVNDGYLDLSEFVHKMLNTYMLGVVTDTYRKKMLT